ncbi:MAG: class II D-tagatose-bisphosphate aldolase, non-catalytic subunit [Candidatus Devosia euplotis]|nr:class II D-tagatose-bisphosphate aldolase, non-catalytic subunit [Candidatus Devosia euplotis]
MSRLRDIVSANRGGTDHGIPSYCAAYEATLRAILAAYRDDRQPILIEATCSQVNQDGGYTCMTPRAFMAFVESLAMDEGVDPKRPILDGDHLGPNPWKGLSAAVAMEKAKAMVADYVTAGFTKIHLDASMGCADDAPLAEVIMAERAAALCAVAEAAAAGRPLDYVIGTEVPVPGGETETLNALAVTTSGAVWHTVDLHRKAFASRGLQAAFERVLAVVVRPGVDFGNDQVLAYAPEAARALVASVAVLPGLAFEAHSTDYQTQAGLAGLVAGRFAILKVGPELTFAYRQAVVVMEQIEAALAPVEPSDILDPIIAEMRRLPGHWRSYVDAGAQQERMLLYGLSDRIRYYWPQSAIAAALARLHANIAARRPEPGLVAQFTGGMVESGVESRDLPRRMVDRMLV